MKTIPALISAILISLLAACGQSNLPQEGKQFERLPTDLSAYQLPVVTEVFSLNCGHCANMEPAIPQLEAATNQTFGKVHVIFNQSAQVSAMIYYSAQTQLGKTPNSEMMKAMFDAIQMGYDLAPKQQEQAINNAFTAHALASPDKLTESQKKAVLDAMEKAAEISQKGQINAVPTFIVNGKYMVLLAGHKDLDGIANTINYLIQQP
ncbi:hypothetical protein GCM10007938_36240 [Vibrio zhanjiangensis]|uniref:Thiol:disulfide interchange protein n=1 Tax=Vibrio zhanjiangensis TaxID=1046128 RepID=A0ABQ6F4K1_9VIBR|nr:thiol:disulfide interchange protein DsbA/DsbL [Vibrio zhanjiangensis]GLT19841.1 hypothetical protein GCM10007938_36240 [Vibrio zhanjiangensis]